MSTRRLVAALALLAVVPLPAAEPALEPALELDTSTITGHRELPRVMAIVPWKKSPAGEPPGRPAKSLLDETLSPVDRLVMRRQAEAWSALAAPSPSNDAAAARPVQNEEN